MNNDIKLIGEIDEADLQRYPVWYFPMDEAVENGDLIVKPVSSALEDIGSFEYVVKADFCEGNGNRRIGYIYWHPKGRIFEVHPCMFLGGGNKLRFWGGVKPPSEDEKRLLRGMQLPISYCSEPHFGLTPMSGMLEGLYCYDVDGSVAVSK